MPKQPHPVDVLVGRRLREARIAHDFSQYQLAAHVGLTYQQIQKYEAGKNRISASRLSQFASFFGLPEQWFFGESDFDMPDRPSGELLQLIKQCQGLEKQQIKLLQELVCQLPHNGNKNRI